MRYCARLISSRVLASVELLIVAAALLGVLCLNDYYLPPAHLRSIFATRISFENLLISAAVLGFWCVLVKALDLYQERVTRPFFELCRVSMASAGSAALLMFLLGPSHAGLSSAVMALRFFTICVAAMSAFRCITGWLSGAAWAQVLAKRNIIIVGTGRRGLSFFRDLRTGAHRYQTLLGFVDTGDSSLLPGELQSLYLGSIDKFERILFENVVDEVWIALPAHSCYPEITRTVAICNQAGVEAKYPDDILPGQMAGALPSALRPRMISLRPALHDSRLFVKRCLDIAFSFIALVLLAPLLVAIALAIKLTNPGPVFFRQQRYGLGRRRFFMVKFRTMVVDAEARLTELERLNEAGGPIFKMRNDPRITPIGRFLRRTSLDELPQLFNIFNGDMSLVGPRPMSVRDVSLFEEGWLMRRFSVKPGLTCLWQVNGRSNTSFHRWMELDLQYIENWSLRLDAQILALTIPAVVKGSGAM